ncbi:MAG: hypothetical protein HYZ29_14895 [Myxococcales bacterium]|nr:hypothetical protein [Myxococcales bacterium]
MRDFAHQTTVWADVREAGDLLSYPRFREGRFELATASERATLMTTMLTDVATALWSRCLELDPGATRRVLRPNGFTSARFLIVFEARDFEVEVQRRARHPWLLLIPGYAELPSSYRVTLHVRATTRDVAESLLQVVASLVQSG